MPPPDRLRPAIAVHEHHQDRPGPVIVLVHGTMDRGSSFARVVRDLAQHPTTTYDRGGYGKSLHAQPPAAGLDDHVSDLASVLAGRPSIVVGHSYGGVIALAAALRYRDVVRGAGAFEPPTPWTPSWPRAASRAVDFSRTDDPAAVAEAFMRRMVGDAGWANMPERTRAARRAEAPALITDVRSIESEPFTVAELKELRVSGVPVRLAAGTETWTHQRESTERLADALGDEVTWIQGASHGAHLSHPAQFAAWIRSICSICSICES